MSSDHVTTLLIDAPAGRHFAQLHKDSKTLARAVTLYVETGLRRDGAVIMITPPTHTALYLRYVREAGIDPDPRRLSRQLVVLDAHHLLGRVMPGGIPVWEEFHDAFAPVIEKAAKSGHHVRVYAELVNDLWRAGNTAQVIRLEEFWNELARLYRFSLFCGYEMSGFDEKSYDGPISEIGRTHFAVSETHEDQCLQQALDVASAEILGSPLSALLTYSGADAPQGEQRLPIGRRTMLWLKRNMPNTMISILKRARHHSPNDN